MWRGQPPGPGQTVAGKVEELGAGQLGHGEHLLNVVAGDHQPGERRGLVGEGHAGGHLGVGAVQLSSVMSTKMSRNIVTFEARMTIRCKVSPVILLW